MSLKETCASMVEHYSDSVELRGGIAERLYEISRGKNHTPEQAERAVRGIITELREIADELEAVL